MESLSSGTIEHFNLCLVFNYFLSRKSHSCPCFGDISLLSLQDGGTNASYTGFYSSHLDESQEQAHRLIRWSAPVCLLPSVAVCYGQDYYELIAIQFTT